MVLVPYRGSYLSNEFPQRPNNCGWFSSPIGVPISLMSIYAQGIMAARFSSPIGVPISLISSLGFPIACAIAFSSPIGVLISLMDFENRLNELAQFSSPIGVPISLMQSYADMFNFNHVLVPYRGSYLSNRSVTEQQRILSIGSRPLSGFLSL